MVHIIMLELLLGLRARSMVITSALAPWFISSWLELLLGLRARSMVITSALAPWFIAIMARAIARA